MTKDKDRLAYEKVIQISDWDSQDILTIEELNLCYQFARGMAYGRGGRARDEARFERAVLLSVERGAPRALITEFRKLYGTMMGHGT